MWGKSRTSFNSLLLIAAILVLTVLVAPLYGQEFVPQIFITGNDITSPPSSVLHVYGRDAQGNAIDFAANPVILTSEGTEIASTVSGTTPVGTFTVFLVDLPQGVEEQLPAIQQAIQQFASAQGGMQEQIDSIAIYQVGESAPSQLLPPTTFYNEVTNFFVDELTPVAGSTALRDSLALLLEEVDGLKPRPEMVSSVVVLSDGTDVVSTQFEPQDVVASANEKNIPIHTIWVNGAGLTVAQQEAGQAYLNEGAAATRGFATTLDDGAGVGDLWKRIGAFRDHARVVFQMDSLGGGSYDVVLSLASDPSANDSMVVDIPENQPQVRLDLPPGNESITLPTLDEPLKLRLGASVSWLDDFEREISEASLMVNGQKVADVPVDQLEEFTIEVNNLQYGENEIELLVIDDQGLRASNLPAVITVVQGEQEVIPEDFQPQRELGSTVLNIFLVVVVLAVLVGILFWLSRSGIFSRLTSSRRSQRAKQGVTYTSPEDGQAMAGLAAGGDQGGPAFDARLEIIESVTEMAPNQSLSSAMVRVGRSPSMCDIAFRDDLTVSRQHAVLMLEGNHYRLFDENSTSGSWVNGRQVPEYGVELADGDEIHLGAVHLIYRQY